MYINLIDVHSISVKFISRLEICRESTVPLWLTSCIHEWKPCHLTENKVATHFLLFIESRFVKTAKWKGTLYHSQSNGNRIACMSQMIRMQCHSQAVGQEWYCKMSCNMVMPLTCCSIATWFQLAVLKEQCTHSLFAMRWASEMPVRQSGPIDNIPSGGHKIGCCTTKSVLPLTCWSLWWDEIRLSCSKKCRSTYILPKKTQDIRY